MRRAVPLLMTLALVAAACADDGDDGGATDAADTAETGEASETSDDAGEADGEPGEATGAENDLVVDVSPAAHGGLVAVVTVEAVTPSTAKVTATSGDHVVETPMTAEPGSSFEIPVVGLRSDRDYELVVEVEADGGDVTTVDATWSTDPLPDWIADHELTIDVDRAAPGYRIVEVDPENPEDEGPNSQYLVAYDDANEVVWYYTNTGALGGIEQTIDGTLLMHYWPFGVREVDVAGNVVNHWRPQPAQVEEGEVDDEALLAETDPDQIARFEGALEGNPGDAEPLPVRADWVSLTSAHHENWPMPNGNVLLLSTTIHELTDEQRQELCPGDPNEFDVISDVVVEHEPDGTVVRSWDLWDAIDVMEFPGSTMCVDDDLFAEAERRDWTHANSAMYDPVRDAVLISVRHTDQIVAFDHLDDEGPQTQVRWILGAGSTMPYEGELSYHQHAVEVLPDGALVLFDNGNGRPGVSPDDPENPPYSRAVIYDVDDTSDDPSTWSASQRWEYLLEGDDGQPVYTAFIGDADVLPNGNVLITFGGEGAFPPDPADPLKATVVEVVPSGESGGDIVWSFRSIDGQPTTVYRTEHIESFYVGPKWASDG